MKRFILVFILLAVSAGAQAQWVKVGSTSQGTAYLWYPVAYSFPLRTPAGPRCLTGRCLSLGGSITHVRYSAIWLSIAATARLYCAARPHTPAAILKGIGGDSVDHPQQRAQGRARSLVRVYPVASSDAPRGSDVVQRMTEYREVE